jgi:hypothetical protein
VLIIVRHGPPIQNLTALPCVLPTARRHGRSHLVAGPDNAVAIAAALKSAGVHSRANAKKLVHELDIRNACSDGILFL